MIRAFVEHAAGLVDERQTAVAVEYWLAAAEQKPLQQHSHELVYPSAGTAMEWNGM